MSLYIQLFVSILLLDSYIEPLSLQQSPAGIQDVVDALRLLIEQRIQSVKKCYMPNSLYLNGSCFFRSSIKLEKLSRLTNVSHARKSSLLPTSSYQNAALQCELKNASLAVFDSGDEFAEVIGWIVHSHNPLLSSHPYIDRSKFIVGVYTQNGKLFWNDDRTVRDNEFAHFTYSYERGKRLECPVLDISHSSRELPMFVTVRCNEDLPIICRKVVHRCHNNPCRTGRCFSVDDSFVCRCPFLYSGEICQHYSSDAVQTFIGSGIVLMALAVVISNRFPFSQMMHRRRHILDVPTHKHKQDKWDTMNENYYCSRSVGFDDLRNSKSPQAFTNKLHVQTSFNTPEATELVKGSAHDGKGLPKTGVVLDQKAYSTDHQKTLVNHNTYESVIASDEKPNNPISRTHHQQHLCRHHCFANFHHMQSPRCHNHEHLAYHELRGQCTSKENMSQVKHVQGRGDIANRWGKDRDGNKAAISKNRKRLKMSPSKRDDGLAEPSTSRRIIEMSSGIISFILSVLCCSLVYRSRLQRLLNAMNGTALNRPIDDHNSFANDESRPGQNGTISFMCNLLFRDNWLNSVYKLPTTKLTIPSFGVLILLIILMTKRTNHTWLFCGYGSMPIVFDPFSKVRRFDSAAVFGILALEISHIFDEFIFHAYRYISHGPLLDLLKQTGLVILIGARYFPILAALELNPPSVICYALTASYMWMEVAVKVLYDSVCPHRNNIMDYGLELSTFIKNISNSTIDINIGQRQHMLARALRSSNDAILFKVLKQFPYYTFSLFVACRLTCLGFLAMYDTLYPLCISQLDWIRKSHLYGSGQYKPNGGGCGSSQRLRNVLESEIYAAKQHWKECRYVQYLLSGQRAATLHNWSTTNIFVRLLGAFYPYHPHFAYSKQIINIYAIAFTLVYYFTFWTLEKSHTIIDRVFRLIRFLFFYTFSQSITEDKLKTFDDFREKLRSEVIHDLRIITGLTGLLCVMQLVLGLKQYQRQMLNAYTNMTSQQYDHKD